MSLSLQAFRGMWIVVCDLGKDTSESLYGLVAVRAVSPVGPRQGPRPLITHPAAPCLLLGTHPVWAVVGSGTCSGSWKPS